MEWALHFFAFFFIKLLDTMAYGLLAVAYNIFYAVSNLNLFGGNAAGQQLYTTITSRFYNVLSIVMVFIFAYNLIMMIIDPDGKETKSSATLVKDTFVSIIAIILLPTVFRYMAVFQSHVLQNNTIGAIILGQNGTNSDRKPGKSIALMVFSSFYHPNNTTYSTFINEDGEIRPDAVSACTAENGNQATCEKYKEALDNWFNDNSYGIGSITGVKDLRHAVQDSVEYMWFLSTGAGLVTAWFFFAYSIALGTRAVKLGVLQLISPIPLVLRIFPQTRKSFETWFGEIKKTYLEVFIRLAVIFFIVALIQEVPTFIRIIFESNDGAGDGLTKCIATVCLILGMLQFAKDAPDLFKTLFSNGGNLLSGLNFSPRVRSHIESNPYGMKAISMGTSAIGGTVGNIAKRFMESYRAGGGKATGTSNLIKSAFAGLSAAPRGLLVGARSGFKNTPNKLTRNDMANTFNQGVTDAHKSLDERAFGKTRENIRNLGHDMANANGSASYLESIKNFGRAQKNTAKEWAAKNSEEAKTKREEFIENLKGNHRDYATAATSAETVSSSANDLMDLAKVENDKIKTRKTAVEERVNAGETYTHTDGRNYKAMYKTKDDLIRKYGAANLQEIANADGTISVITKDGISYTVSAGADGKVLARVDDTALVKSKAAIEQAIANNQKITANGRTYANISTDLNAVMNNATVTSTSTGSNGEQIRQLQTAGGEAYVEYTFADGTKHVESSNGNVKYTISADNVVQSKEVKSTDSTGRTVTDVTENSQVYLEKVQKQIVNNTTYNIEQVYDEFTDEESRNVAKALTDFSDARATQASTMLKTLKDNDSTFSKAYKSSDPHNPGDYEKFATKFGETIEEFLKKMSDKNAGPITEKQAKQFKEIKKIMSTEVKRSKMNADAEKKRREAEEASKPKKDESKKS